MSAAPIVPENQYKPNDVFELNGLAPERRKQLASLDADGDGMIDDKELASHLDKHEQEKQMKKLFMNMVWALLAFCFILLGCLTYMTYTVVELSKETSVEQDVENPVLKSKSGDTVITGKAKLSVQIDGEQLPTEEEYSRVSSFQRYTRALLSPEHNSSHWVPIGSVPRSIVNNMCDLLGDGISQSNIHLPRNTTDPNTGDQVEFLRIHDILIYQFIGCYPDKDTIGIVKVDGTTNAELVCQDDKQYCHVYMDPAHAVVAPVPFDDDETIEGNMTLESNRTVIVDERRRLTETCAKIDYGRTWRYALRGFTLYKEYYQDIRSYCLTFFGKYAYVEYQGTPVCGTQYQIPFKGAYYKWCKFPGVDALTQISRKAGVPDFVFSMLNSAFKLIGKGSLDGKMCASSWNIYPAFKIVQDCYCRDGCDDCFPAESAVHVEDKGLVRMDELSYGDRVMILKQDGTVGYEDVYLFGHKNYDDSAEYIIIETDNGMNLQLSPNHFATLCTSGCDTSGLKLNTFTLTDKYASLVKVGDVVVTVDYSTGNRTFATVINTAHQNSIGLFNPYVRGGGHIIVDGVVASVHSKWFLHDSSYFSMASHPALYDMFLFLVYVLYLCIGPKWSFWLADHLGVHTGGDDKLSPLLFAYGITLFAPVLTLALFCYMKRDKKPSP